MAGNNLGQATGSVKINTSPLKNADIALRSAGTSLIQLGSAAVGAFADIVGTAAKFEKEMDFVQAVTASTDAEMQQLKDSAIELGKKSIFGPVALSQAFVDLAKAGATTQQIIDGVGLASVNLATAADVEIPFAGENLINILNTYKLGAGDAVHVTDLLAGAANASSVELSDLVISMKYAGPVANGLGISFDDTNTALSIFGKIGIKGSTAGTALRAMLLNLSPATEKAKDRMTELGIITKDGKNRFFDAAGNAKDLSQVFEVLKTSMDGLTKQDKVDAIRDLFGVRAEPAAIEAMFQGAAGFKALNEEINRTTAAEVAQKRMDNLDGSVKKLKATLEAIKTEAGGPFQTMLKGWVDGLRNVLLAFDSLPGPVKTMIVGAIGLIGVMAILAGVFLLTIGNMIRAARVAGEVINAFRFIAGAARTATTANAALSSSLLLNPIVLITLAIIALGVAFYELYTHVEGFHKFIDGLWQDIQAGWDGVTKGFSDFGKDTKDFFRSSSKLGTAFTESFSNQGITTDLGNITGWVERLGNALGDAWRWSGKFLRSVSDIFEKIPGQVVGFLSSVAGAVGGFLASLATTIGNAFIDAAASVGRFFLSLPGIILHALSVAGGHVVDFLSKLPERIAYWTAFAIGRWIRFWYYDIPRTVYNVSKKVLPIVGRFLESMKTKFFQILTKIITTVIGWGVRLFMAFVGVFSRIVNAVVNELIALPTQVANILLSIMNFFVTMVPQLISAAWNIGVGIYHAIIDFFTALPAEAARLMAEVLIAIMNFGVSAVSSAINIGTDIFNGIIDFFEKLPGRIVDLLLEAVDAVGGFATRFYNKTLDIGKSLWNGFRDGLFGSPHTKIEYAMWDMEDNMKASLGNVAKNVRTLQGLQTRIPQLNAGMVGLPSAGAAAVASNGGGQIWQQNAPLVGQATIRDDRDIVTLARQLSAEQARQQRARGRG